MFNILTSNFLSFVRYLLLLAIALMPRTNQTSCKSTGGIVPRAAFALFAINDSLNSADDGNSYNSDASDNSRAGSADSDTVESAEE
jgi:hypothetical protein